MAADDDTVPPAVRDNDGARLLERPVRLSESTLWRLQRDYFEDRGVQAWASGDVPYGATNNPALARGYVQVFEGLVADLAAGSFGAFDPAEPLYVVELGAGSGGFAHHFLRALDPDVLPAPAVYVLTDLAGSNLDFWRDHPKLTPYMRAGVLDMARFDAVADDALRLEVRGGALRAGDVTNPLVVVANYFFDVLPQDLFVATDDGLFEERVAVGLADGAEFSDDDALRHLALATERHPASAGYYGDRVLDAALATVARRRARRYPGRFLFPVVGLRVLENLRRLSGGRLVVLTHERPGSVQDIVTTVAVQADRDPFDPAAVDAALQGSTVPVAAGDGDGEPADGEPATALRAFALLGMAAHGRSFSLVVEQDAFAAAAMEWDGQMLVPRDRPNRTAVSALVTGAPGALPHTRRRFELAFEEGSPEERYYALFGGTRYRSGAAETPGMARGPEAQAGEEAAADDERVPPEELSWVLSLLRICAYDTEVLGELYPLFRDAAEDAPDVLLDDLVEALRTVCDRHYPIGGKSDPALAAAALLAPLGRYADALEFLDRSADLHGPQPQVSYNTALCQLHLGNLPAALAAADEALAFEKPSAGARQLREVILEEMGSGDGSGPGAARVNLP